MKYIGENAIKKLISLIKSDLKKKLDKNQGTANSGKILGVNATGEVAPTDTEVATLVDVPNGIVKGDGSTLSAAVVGTDYMAPVTGGTAGQLLTKTADGQEWQDREKDLFIVNMTSSDMSNIDSVDKTFEEVQAALTAGKTVVARIHLNKSDTGNSEIYDLMKAAWIKDKVIAFSLTAMRGTMVAITMSSEETRLSQFTAQSKITATGLLKGDGKGGVSAATAGTDYMATPTGGTAGQVLTKTADSQQWADAPKSLPDGGTTGDALVKSADGGSWETPVEASLVDLPIITASQTDLTAGTSPLATGELYVVYE